MSVAINEHLTTTIELIIDQIDDFDEECSAVEHTDTDVIWEVLNDIRRRLKKLLVYTKEGHPVKEVMSETGKNWWTIYNNARRRGETQLRAEELADEWAKQHGREDENPTEPLPTMGDKHEHHDH